MADKQTPWLEPGAGEHANKLRQDVDVEATKAAAMVSAAITFKRLVDLVEPILKGAAEVMAAEQADSKRRK